MFRKVVLIFLVSVFFSTAVFPPTVLKKLTISVNKNLSLVATPGIARNEAVDEWLVTWELTTPARRNVLGRLVKSDGEFASKTKTFVRNVLSHAIAYNSVDHTYLILYGTSTGLRGQLFTENLIPRGTFVDIAPIPNVARRFPVAVTYSAVDNTFLAVWMPSEFFLVGYFFPTLRAVILDSRGKPLTEPRILVQAPKDEFGIGSLGRGSFTVSRNEAKNRSLVMLNDGNSKLVGYHIQSDGALLSTTPIVFQLGALDAGQCSFAGDGSGFASWVSNSSFRLRRISPEGVATSPAKQISKLHGGPTLLFDSFHNQYFSAWLSTKNVLAGGIHSRTTGALKGKPFIIEDFSSGGRLQLLNSSYDSKRGNALVAWVEESTAGTSTTIRLKGALLKLE
jgi:hypothetical protein